MVMLDGSTDQNLNQIWKSEKNKLTLYPYQGQVFNIKSETLGETAVVAL